MAAYSPESSDTKDPERRFSKEIEVTTNDGLEQAVLTTSKGESVLTVDPAAERKLVWKFDLRILPVLAIMYLFNALDKSNLVRDSTSRSMRVWLTEEIGQC